MTNCSDCIEEAILDLREEWDTNPKTINNGECMEFINQLFLQNDFSGKPVVRMETGDLPVEFVEHEDGFKSEPYHMWVTDGSHHYDAEVPSGVPNWKELPFFKRTLGF